MTKKENELRIESEIGLFAIKEFIKELQMWCFDEIVSPKENGTWDYRGSIVTGMDVLNKAKSIISKNEAEIEPEAKS